MSWGESDRPGTDHEPLWTSGTVMTEHTVDCRCARSVPRRGNARATTLDTTLCDEPVSTTKSRPGPLAKCTSTLSDTSPVVGVTVSGTDVPRSPCVSVAGA